MAVVSHKSVVVVFARELVAGGVKTRLAARVGDALALAFYRAFLEDLLAEVQQGPWGLRVAVAGDPQRFAMTLGLEPSICFAQEAGDLGDRMAAAFQRMLAAESCDRCLLVGSDMPQLALPALALADAALAMGEADLVLGPALDGGYYLVGMARPHPIFSGIAWSTDAVLPETRARAKQLGLRTTLLAEAFDVDTAADLDRLGIWLAEADPAVLPHTRAVWADFSRG
jgi:rSAM/selenodomain-associated transferase 1